MSTIVTRAGKGSPLTHDEMDDNFTNLNTDKLEKTSADLEPQSAPAYQEGRLWYDLDEKALSYYNDISASSMQVGFEQWVRVRNNTGSLIPDGSVVYVNGALGQNPTIALADADVHNASQVIGLVTADIANNSVGHVTITGLVKNQNTSSFNDGDTLYLSQTAGSLTATPPVGTAAVIAVGIVAHSHATQGKILVSVNDAKDYNKIVSVKDFGAVGDGATDDTTAIQTAITSATGKQLYFPEGTYMLSDSLLGVSDSHFVFEAGTTLQFIVGSSVTTGDAILYFDTCTNVKLIGNGARLVGERKGTGINDIVQGISLLGCTDVLVENFRIYDCAGDGVLVQGAADNTPIYSERITIRDVLASNCMRNGFAVTSCIDGLLENCIAYNTNGKDPKAGFDIEPEGGSTRMQNVRLVNCVGTDNEAFDYSLVLGGNTTPVTNSVGVELLNCVARDSRTYTTTIGFAVLNHRDTMANDGYVRLTACKAMNINNHGLMVRNIDKDGQDVTFDVELIDTALVASGSLIAGVDSPCVIYTNTASSVYADPGGIRGKLRVVDNTRDRTPYYITSAGTPWTDIVLDVDWINTVGKTNFPFMDAGTTRTYISFIPEPYRVDRTSNITLSSRYSNFVLSNKGAVGSVVFTLPAVAVGLSFSFEVFTNQVLRITPNASDRLRPHASADAKYMESSTIGSTALIYANQDGTDWVVKRFGTWTDEP